MPRKPPGPKAKALGAALRRIRDNRGLSMKEVADRIGMSESVLSRLETGKRNVDSEDVAALLAIYETVGPERDELLAMARTPDEPEWLQQVGTGLPADSVKLVTHEARANRIVDWAPLLVPGLLQHPAYSRAYMLSEGKMSDRAVGAMLMTRRSRQESVAGRGVKYVAYLWEPVLRNQIGGPAVMLEQLRVLASPPDYATLRLVPHNVGANPAFLTPFMLLEFPADPAQVHIELPGSGLFRSDPLLLEYYSTTVDRLSEDALTPTESTEAINEIAREVEREVG